MTTSTETIDNTETIATVKEAVESALALIRSNEGEYTTKDSECTLTQEVLKACEAFKLVTELTAGEKLSLAMDFFLKLGRLSAQYEAEYFVVMEVRGRTLQNPLAATTRALTHESNMRYRQFTLTKWVIELLEEALAA